MTDKMDNFAARCKKLPNRLKQWDAFTQLRSAHAAIAPKDHPVETQGAKPVNLGAKSDFRLAQTYRISWSLEALTKATGI